MTGNSCSWPNGSSLWIGSSLAFDLQIVTQCAPLSVQEVLQVVVTPCWHFLQAATHWLISFGLYDGKFCATQSLTEPVVSSAGLQEVAAKATTTFRTNFRMRQLLGRPKARWVLESSNSAGALRSMEPRPAAPTYTSQSAAPALSPPQRNSCRLPRFAGSAVVSRVCFWKPARPTP